MITVQVLFDREDRCYEFGEEVTGNVAVEATSDVHCAEVAIRHGWHTHGRGYQDGLYERQVLSTGKTHLREGECRTFPFHFRVPNGPVTYHGHFLSVDWYVAAHARTSQGDVFNAEEDFLLVGGEPAGTLLLGSEEVQPDDIPSRSTELVSDSPGTVELPPGNPMLQWIGDVAKSIARILFLFVVAGLFLTGLSNARATSSYLPLILILAAIALVGLSRIVPDVYHNAYRGRLDLRQLHLKPDAVRRGSPVRCHMEIGTRAAVHLRDIKVTLFAQERVTRSAGTVSTTDYYALPGRTFLRSFDQELSAGRHFTFDYALPVAEDTAPTFRAKNNGLEWYVKVQLGLRGWPSMVETRPLTVLP